MLSTFAYVYCLFEYLHFEILNLFPIFLLGSSSFLLLYSSSYILDTSWYISCKYLLPVCGLLFPPCLNAVFGDEHRFLILMYSNYKVSFIISALFVPLKNSFFKVMKIFF